MSDAIQSVKDPMVRARLEALRDVIDTLDAAASSKRTEPATSWQGGHRDSLARAMGVIGSVLQDEAVKGFVSAAELVVERFKAEFAAAEAAQNKEIENGDGRADSLERL